MTVIDEALAVIDGELALVERVEDAAGRVLDRVALAPHDLDDIELALILAL